jgi:TonB family protein
MVRVSADIRGWNSRMTIMAVLLMRISGTLFGADGDPVFRVGGGVSTPKVVHKVDPAYSHEAERDRVQGTALYRVIVDKSGRPRDIELLSPIGYGLDEKGTEAIQKWRFAPGMKDGMPVSVLAQIEINFRFPGLPFDSKMEANRTSYNAALHNFQIPDRKVKALETIRKLSDERYPPAMSLLGAWMVDGSEVTKDVPGGIDLIKKAADKYDSTGLFALGKLYAGGVGAPADSERGLKLIHEASTYGSREAQFYLGTRYESGDSSIPRDPERARYYFRLCAARATAACQFHLGKLLTSAPGQEKGDPVQALAWLELAHDGSVKEAEPLAIALREKLSDEELHRVEKLKTQLLRQ